MEKRYKLLLASVPILFLIISIVAFVINTRIAEGRPVILELTPEVINIGDTLEITGRHFGSSQDSSKIFVSSTDLLSRNILSWEDFSIIIKIPELTGSGLITIKTDRGLSKPVVIVVNETVPFIGTGSYLPGLPFIEYIDPYTGGTGTQFTMRGDNFGVSRNNSELLFSTQFSRERDTVSGDSILENFQELEEDGIINWTNNEISFYLPEFVKTGDVYLKTESGYSNAVFFEQSMNKSGLIPGSKKSYMFNQSLNLQWDNSEEISRINAWFSSPVKTVYQRNISVLPNFFLPRFYKIDDVSMYKIQLDNGENSIVISQNTIVDVYEQNYIIDETQLNDVYDKTSPLYLNNIISTELVPSSLDRIKTVSASVTRRKGSSFNKAKAIYDYVIARLAYDEVVEDLSPDKVIDNQIGNSQAYSILFCALARSSGIPARPVSGILVDSNKNVINHWWAEFFLQDYGWFPVDPALADGLIWENPKENAVEYYWGNIDNQHIAFSRGEKSIPRFFPDGIIYSNNDYALLSQNIETDSLIINLRSSWSDVRIKTIY
ncbi:MAG: IPT/TIG domain-containing protein [Spirochaetaceae bacterium]|jgi:hypothetical protein|nr:IPT/TIG domain-containing protein [Spirochaetaceae bacterium]